MLPWTTNSGSARLQDTKDLEITLDNDAAQGEQGHAVPSGAQISVAKWG